MNKFRKFVKKAIKEYKANNAPSLFSLYNFDCLISPLNDGGLNCTFYENFYKDNEKIFCEVWINKEQYYDYGCYIIGGIEKESEKYAKIMEREFRRAKLITPSMQRELIL